MFPKESRAKQKIIATALTLFSEKGFTETTMREIAATIGVRAPSLYTHFESKFSILEHLLDDYKHYASNMKPPESCWVRLTKDATPDDVMSCLTLHFPKPETEYYLKMVVMLFQEQCRNEVVREFMTKDLILWHEQYITTILRHLVNVGALHRDIDIDFWAKIHASLNYALMARYVLGIGEAESEFKGKGIVEMKRTMYDTIFKLHSTKA